MDPASLLLGSLLGAGVTGAVAVGIGKRLESELVHGVVGTVDPETTCHYWIPLDWTNALPTDLRSSGRDTFVFAANLMKYTYQEACKSVEKTFPHKAVVKPLPTQLQEIAWLYGVDRGDPELFGFAGLYHQEATPEQPFLVITVRGTMTRENWLTDFHAVQDNWIDGTKVHHGFLTVAKTLFSQIDVLLEEFPGLPVFIVGHSLGAAITGILSYYVWHRTRGSRYVKSIVFGCPRTGDPAFAEAVGRNTDAWNVQNLADVTVEVPLSITATLGDVYIYQHWQKVRAFTFNRGSIPENHHIQTYLEAVSTLPLTECITR